MGGPVASVVLPAVTENFNFASISSLLGSSLYVASETKASSLMRLDVAVPAPGGGPSLRYDIPKGTVCTAGATIGRGLSLPKTVKEIWLEWSLRFPIGFQSGNTNCAGGLHSQKTVLLYYASKDARVQYVTGIYTSHQPLFGWGGGPDPYEVQVPNVKTGCAVASCYDGKWHSYRIHVRLSSSATMTDGITEFWVDGVKVVSKPASTFSRATGKAATGFSFVMLGANRNSPPLTPVSYWWGPASVYTASPGW